MRLLQKVLAGVCLSLGLFIVLALTAEILNPTNDAEDRADSVAALLVVGLPPTALGAWLIWNLRQQHERSLETLADQQEQRFLQLLQDHKGDLTVLQFATATQLSLEESKVYLDEKAQQLNASFDVLDNGAVVYRFPL
ncbi:hypothetical protein [Nodosilinea sp. FACHB-13]|uniref:hypothetical protein n=1 Tax=Cyanophyceae TaxID=3028117 RepID=UPI00168475E1|nr:hypothetical protein [Nodosilinea sp. FACHB-13]